MMKYIKKMERAEKVAGVNNAFKPGALAGEELARFYYDKTMESRTGDKYKSPIQDIMDECQELSATANSFLLMGHWGCGKSTELNEMSGKLKEQGYHIYTVDCKRDLDMFNLAHSDLLILMGEALIKIADEIGCSLDKDMESKITGFWNTTIEKINTDTRSDELSVEAGVKAKTPVLMPVLRLFARLQADLKFNVEKRKVHREVIVNRSSDWLLVLNSIADKITEKSEYKQPIIIFEDLDKIDCEVVWRIFSNYSSTLTGASFPTIYTFPIALSYDPKFTALGGYFRTKILPMIKQKTVDGEPYEDGVKVVTEIVKKRAKLELFEPDALDKMIRKTGGSLRDLFSVISEAATRARRRESEVITVEDADAALESHKTSIVKLIDRKRHLDLLLKVHKGNQQFPEEGKEALLEMLQANAVLAYNGKGRYSLHPLVADFLKEQGLIDDKL